MKAQYIKIDKYGKFYYSDADMKILHREDGPAFEFADGYKAWWIDGKRHRTDGPAVEGSDGYKAWYVNGYLHRTDGPAVETAFGSKSWSIDGESLTEEQFDARFWAIELTLEDIAAKFNINVNNLKIVK